MLRRIRPQVMMLTLVALCLTAIALVLAVRVEGTQGANLVAIGTAAVVALASAIKGLIDSEEKDKD